jgi:signal transduction histidine kinase/DNA-binding response OmpR family regulator
MPAEGKVNILVVDDLPEKVLTTELVLADLGENVVRALSGREALRRLLEQDFAVILLDVNMPDMDGFETAELIRQRPRSARTPIIFVTAFGDDLLAARGYSLGAVDYILSPVVPDVLRTKVGVFVDLYRKTEQVRFQAEQQAALACEQAARAAAEEATRRSLFLAEASTALADSLDFDSRLRTLVNLVVPGLADLAGVAAAGEDGRPWRGELAWTLPPDPAVHSRPLGAVAEADDPLRAAQERVLTSGQAVVLEGLDAPYPPGGGVTGRLRAAAVLPLRARGRSLGALTLAQGASGRRFSAADLALAEDLAGRAAVALDNARLFHQLQESARQKDEFLAMLAHELRNPLAPVRNAVQLLRMPQTGAAEQRWARDVIDRQVRHMVRLVDDLLDVSRLTHGLITLKAKRVDAAEVAAGAVEISRPLIDDRRHLLTVSAPPRPLRLEADPTRLEQVLSNLLNNAAKYTDPGGRITLTVGREGGAAVFRVCDTGHGLSPEMLARVFEPFTQVDRSLDRAQGGLGLGLALVKRLVELHGGAVEAHSPGLGRGSEFVVRLPALPEGAPAPPAESNGRAAAPAPARVLVVDDNVDAAESLALYLRATGCEVCVAHDGPSALQAAESFRPAAALLDIGLPHMDGYELAGRFRARPGGEGVLLVAVTGYGRPEDRARAREAGFDHHFTKPVEPEALDRLLADLPHRGAAAGLHRDAAPRPAPVG